LLVKCRKLYNLTTDLRPFITGIIVFLYGSPSHLYICL